jgi:hypothetical protein
MTSARKPLARSRSRCVRARALGRPTTVSVPEGRAPNMLLFPASFEVTAIAGQGALSGHRIFSGFPSKLCLPYVTAPTRRSMSRRICWQRAGRNCQSRRFAMCWNSSTRETNYTPHKRLSRRSYRWCKHSLPWEMSYGPVLRFGIDAARCLPTLAPRHRHRT